MDCCKLDKTMQLKRFFQETPEVAIAFSGGVDSAYLLYAAMKYGKRVKAYYVKTAFQPAFELEDARNLAKTLGAELQVLETAILRNETVAANPPDRCYHCKKALFSRIMAAARADGFSVLLDGTNASDDTSSRPGMRAIAELAVRSPLRECGLTKNEIRKLSRDAGLFTHDKPAYSCLATRIPTGETITEEKLQRTEKAERYLAGLGFRDFRVRCQADAARLQITEDDLGRLLEHRQQILEDLKQYYTSVLLDLEVRHEQ